MEKNHRQYSPFFTSSLERIKVLLWSYLERSKHTERFAQKELSERIIAERTARQRREERAERKRLEKKLREKTAQIKQLRRLRAKALNTLASQRRKVEALVRKTGSDSFKVLLRDIEGAIKILRDRTDDAILQIISARKKAPISARTIIEIANLLEEIRPIIMSAASTENAEILAHLIMERTASSANISQSLIGRVISQLIKELDPRAAIRLLLSAYHALDAEHAAKAFIAEAIKQIIADNAAAVIPILSTNQETTAVNSTKINFSESTVQENLGKTDNPPEAIEAPARGDAISGPNANISAAEEMLLSENPAKAKKHLKALQKAAASAEAKISFDQLTLGYFYAGILFDKTFSNKQSNTSVEISRGQEQYTSIRSLIRIIEVLEGQIQAGVEKGQPTSAAISVTAETLLYGLIMRKLKARSRALKVIAALKNKVETWNELLAAVENRDIKKVKRVLERAVENIWPHDYYRRIAA
jgi:hypothetical protein